MVSSVDSHVLLTIIEQTQQKFLEEAFSAQSFYDFLLQSACRLVNSQAAFLASVVYPLDEAPKLHICASVHVNNNPGAQGVASDDVSRVKRWERNNTYLQNLAASVLLTKKPLIYNNLSACGRTEYHLPVYNFVAVPVVFRGKVNFVLGLISTSTSFCQQLLDGLSPFITTCTTLLSRHQADIPSPTACAKFPGTYTATGHNTSTELHTVKQVAGDENKIERILDNLDDVIWSASVDNSVLYYVNNACKKLYGYPAQLFYADRLLWFKMIHPEDAARILASQENLIKCGYNEQEYRIVLPDGQIKWIISRSWTIKDENGNPVRVDGISRDAAVRKNAAENSKFVLAKEQLSDTGLLTNQQSLASNKMVLRQMNEQLSHYVSKLEKSEAALIRAQRLAKIGNFEWNLQTGVLSGSAEVFSIIGAKCNGNKTGFTVESFISAVHADDKKIVQKFIHKLLTKEKSWEGVQYRIITDNNQIKSISAFVDHIEKNAQGHIIHLSGLIQDVTGSVLAMQQMEEERNRAELALWGGNIGMWDWNVATGSVKYSKRWAEMLGYTLDEIAPAVSSWADLVHPDDLPLVYEKITLTLEGKIPFFKSEHRLRHKNGEWIWVLDSGKVLERNKEGKATRAIGTHLDITEKKTSEEEVYKLALVAQKTENGVVITDASGFTEWVNDGFIRITGYTLAEVKGKKPGEMLQGPQTDKATVAFMHEKISQGCEFDVEILNYHKSGEKYWLSIAVQPIFNKQGILQQFIAIQTDITKRKQAEGQLHFQANILGNVKDSVIVTDLQGKVIYYNQGAESIFGYTAQEMLGNTLLAIYPQVPDPKIRQQTLEKLKSGIAYDGEWQAKNKKGEKIWVDVKSTLMLDAKGEPVGLIGVSKDITDRKKAEEKLRQSEAYLQSIFDATIQSYFLIDTNYQIIKFNKTAADSISKIYNKPLQVGDSMLEYSDPDALEDFKTNVQKAFSGEKVLVSREVACPNNRKLWFDVQYLPALNEEKEVYGVAFVALDITQRKQTQIALLKSYHEVQNFKNALNASALISITDLRGKILEVNQTFCDTSKFTREELLGKTHNIVNSQYHTKEFFADMWKTIAAGNSWRGEIKNKAKDGTYYWVDTSINPILDENGKIIQYLSIRNLITERKKAEEDREKLIKNLTKFAFMTAHNLRGPLARILGLVSILNLDDPTDAINKIAMEKLKLSAEELDAVIHKMIDMVNLKDLG